MEKPLVVASNLQFGYKNQMLTAPVDLTIGRGRRCALLGGSGVGKSTLLKALLQSHLGKGWSANDTDLRWTGDVEWPDFQKIGYTPQEPSLAAWLTVRGNLHLGASSHSHQDVADEHWLDLV